MPRLFFATLLTAAEQQQLQQGLQGFTWPDNVQWVPAQQLHLTLAFLGDTLEVMVPRVREHISARAWQSFALTLNELQYWPQSQVVCLCAKQTPLALHTLVQNLRTCLQQLGLQPDMRAYCPHITLLKQVTAQPLIEQPQFEWVLAPQAFCLVSSASTHQGSTYTIVQHWSLH